MIELNLVGVRLELPTNSPIVLLREREGRRYLPIWIGQNEAQAIALAQQGVATPRPLTHDLMKSLLDETGVAVDRIVITELRGHLLAVIGCPGTVELRGLLAAERRDRPGRTGHGAELRQRRGTRRGRDRRPRG
jgi:hypothetical protein